MLNCLKYLVIDVDGTMTDGGIYYDGSGNEWKKFCVKDACGFFAAHFVGIQTVVLTGRECAATVRRMNEMKVDYLFQGVKDKYKFLNSFVQKKRICRQNLGYIGDDLNDLAAMSLVGFVGCPANSCIEVLNRADYISPINGGNGAVRDIVEYILRASGEWNAFCAQFCAQSQ